MSDLTKPIGSGVHGEDFIEFKSLTATDIARARKGLALHLKSLWELNRIDEERLLEKSLEAF